MKEDTPDDIQAVNYFNFQFVKQNMQHLEGVMLTIAEATSADKEQRKATKDLIRESFAQKYNWLFEAAHLVDVDTDYDHSIIPIKENQ